MGEYLLNQEVFNFYQSVQKENKLDAHRYILSFLVSNEGKTIFKGIYEINGKEKLSYSHFEKLPLTQESKTHYIELANIGLFDYYSLNYLDKLSDLTNRMVINWGGGELAWFQKYNIEKPKEITEILPIGYFKEFKSYMDISITRSELEYLFKSSDGNSIWKNKLEAVDGIYLIIDEENGDQYIGSATGKNGLWGRWSTYFENPTGGNKRLIEKIKKDNDCYKYFRYSILEVFPKNLTKDEVILKENLYKKKLGSKAHGLNDN